MFFAPIFAFVRRRSRPTVSPAVPSVAAQTSQDRTWPRLASLRLIGTGLAAVAAGVMAGNVAPLFLETPAHSLSYAALSPLLQPGGVALAEPLHELDRLETLAPADLRDLVFAWCAIHPDARAWMQHLPITYAHSATMDGWYHLTARSVTIARPEVHVVLHEYAHANLHHKSAWQKAGVLVGMIRLLLDQAPQHLQARRVLLGVLAEGAQAMRQGQPYGLLHEAYAYLAHWSGGNLAALPAYLQPAYADFLTPGSNHWLQWQARQANATS